MSDTFILAIKKMLTVSIAKMSIAKRDLLRKLNLIMLSLIMISLDIVSNGYCGVLLGKV